MNLMPLQPEPSPLMVHLPANGATTTAEEIRNQLVLAAEFAASTTVDGSSVQTIGQAVLQLLVAARRDADRGGKTFTIIDASDALIERANACRLGDAIGLVNERAMAL